MNHGEIVSFLWGVADLIRDTFKRGKYQDVILPLTVLRRLDCVLAPTKEKLREEWTGYGEAFRGQRRRLYSDPLPGDREETIMKVGFIGLGTMGGSMAMNLIRGGHELTVNDTRRGVSEPHLAAGAKWADTAQAVAEASQVVFTSLPGPVEMEAVALGERGLLSGMRRDAVYFDLTTNAPTTVRKVHAVFAERGVHLLDAPVSGGPKGAATRKLALWVGGDEAIFTQYKPVLDAIGDQAYWVGPIGAGSVAKLAHNCAGYVLQTALAEVFTMGVKAGVDPLALFKAVRQGALGRRRTFEGLVDQFLPGKFEPAAFALRLATKDVTLATALGREVGVPMRLANLALAELTEALNRGWGERDSRVAMLLQEERAGVDIKVPEDRLREVLDREKNA